MVIFLMKSIYFIEKNHNKWSINLLIDYFISEKVEDKINHLARLKKINSYIKNIPINISSIDSYKKIKKLFELSRKSYDLLLLGSDCNPIDKFYRVRDL